MLADEHPVGLLTYVSTLLAVVDPRRESPLERLNPPQRPAMSRDELVRSFLDVPAPETSALLAVIAEMTPDDVLRARIRRELAERHHALPRWLARLSESTVYRCVEMVHVLGDGDNVMLRVRLPEGHELTLVVYIDHNLGTLVKDAFAVPGPIAELVRFMKSKAGDADTRWDDLDPADARVRLTDAIELAAITFPPFETDTWPASRAMVEWASRLLPPGGTGYERPEWDDAQTAALAERFWASPYAESLRRDPEQRDLLESLLWFGTGSGPGDPLRWSPVNVEILLTDWIPRKIVADARHLSKVPTLLRAFIRFCHAESGIRPSLTQETLAAVDHWESEYQRIIRTERPQGAHALLARLGLFHPDAAPYDEDDDLDSIEEYMLGVLAHEVGGEDVLNRLDDRPLPDEEFAWGAVPDDVRERVAEVLALLERCCDELLDVEYRTACRRFLARAAEGDPNVFRRKGRADTAAAAIAWAVGKANDLFGARSRRMYAKDLIAHFGLQQGGVSQRAEVLLRAGGFPGNDYGTVTLGTPDCLVSTRRRRIIEARDHYRQMQQARDIEE